MRKYMKTHQNRSIINIIKYKSSEKNVRNNKNIKKNNEESKRT